MKAVVLLAALLASPCFGFVMRVHNQPKVQIITARYKEANKVLESDDPGLLLATKSMMLAYQAELSRRFPEHFLRRMLHFHHEIVANFFGSSEPLPVRSIQLPTPRGFASGQELTSLFESKDRASDLFGVLALTAWSEKMGPRAGKGRSLESVFKLWHLTRGGTWEEFVSHWQDLKEIGVVVEFNDPLANSGEPEQVVGVVGLPYELDPKHQYRSFLVDCAEEFIHSSYQLKLARQEPGIALETAVGVDKAAIQTAVETFYFRLSHSNPGDYKKFGWEAESLLSVLMNRIPDLYAHGTQDSLLQSILDTGLGNSASLPEDAFSPKVSSLTDLSKPDGLMAAYAFATRNNFKSISPNAKDYTGYDIVDQYALVNPHFSSPLKRTLLRALSEVYTLKRKPSKGEPLLLVYQKSELKGNYPSPANPSEVATKQVLEPGNLIYAFVPGKNVNRAKALLAKRAPQAMVVPMELIELATIHSLRDRFSIRRFFHNLRSE